MEPTNKKRVAIVVPIYQKKFNEDELTSLRHLRKYLGKYDAFAISPPGLKVDVPGLKVVRFPKKYFRGIEGYSALCLTAKFYEAFKDYEYMLIYQTDVIALSDQLMQWCDKGYDYVGAPWFKDHFGKTHEFADAVGNGGFSLRKIDTAIRVINQLSEPWYKTFYKIALTVPYFVYRGRPMVLHLIKTWINSKPSRSLLLEDRYWSMEVPKLVPDFKIPSVEEALKFSFEVNPRDCYARNHNQLPFGAHAWQKHDRAFWEPYLIKKD